ncbi:hypothetical protein J5N97_014773 [Dioscorea zingiberensis]|uniref:Uncharacterized protein n=1 Tax=Dioscorea zingiberensis TaxID=325984 RepID=A0A9D5CUH7_9LILI|nr:hypothetical protein J5N97_014773 [Dioscorea zingiberensis]
MGRPPCCDRSTVKRGLWTAEEDAKLLAYTSTHGTGNWTSVPKKAANQLPGRTDNDVKNYWNTKLSKKLVQRGIDPVTHKPISQLLQSIGGLPGANAVTGNTTGARYHASHEAKVSSLNRDLKNYFHSRPSSTATDLKPIWDFLPLNQYASSMSFAITEASSSSSNAAMTDQLPPPPSDLSWSDFLSKDVFLQNDIKEESLGATSSNQNVHGGEILGEMEEMSETIGESSNTSIGFIDALLDLDREMRLEFPEFLDDSFSFM